MPTYRTYIRRKTTPSPLWDWAQTVVAASPDTAIQRSYESWQQYSSTPVPPLSQCITQVKTFLSEMKLNASSISPGQQAFMDNIQLQVNNFLSSQLDGDFKVLNYPAGFNYGITYGNNAYYNKATLQDIDNMLGVADNGQLILTGASFSNLYHQLLQSTTYSFSTQDEATIDAQTTASSGQIASVLSEFTSAGFVFSDPTPPGGKLQDVFNQLNKAFGSVSALPDTLNALRNAIASFKLKAADSYALFNRRYAAVGCLNAALANMETPSSSNGGMQIDNTNYYVGFTPDKLLTANQLIGKLNTVSNKVSIQLNLSNFSSTSSDLSISGGSHFNIPIAEILSLAVNAHASYDLSKYSSSSTNITVDITYPGVTLFSSAPSVLSIDNSTGWYDLDVLKEIIIKTGNDATGYKLQGSEFDVETLFGPGKEFSRLKTFVLSQQPTITLTFQGSDTSKITSDLQVGASINLNFLGFSLGSAQANYSVHKVDTSSQSGAVIVTFGPQQVSGTLPIQNQLAYVMGGVASYPPNAI